MTDSTGVKARVMEMIGAMPAILEMRLAVYFADVRPSNDQAIELLHKYGTMTVHEFMMMAIKAFNSPANIAGKSRDFESFDFLKEVQCFPLNHLESLFYLYEAEEKVRGREQHEE